MLLSTSKRALLSLFLLGLVTAKGATTVSTYNGSPANLPLSIGNALIEFELLNDGTYFKYGIKASEGGFGWFVLQDSSCVYWFHTSDLPDIEAMTSNLLEVYGTTYCCAGPSPQNSYLVDGATWGSDNYISYFDKNEKMVAVLRFGFTEGETEVRLLSIAYNAEGLTVREGITAASAVPEPTGALLLGVVAMGATLRRRRGK